MTDSDGGTADPGGGIPLPAAPSTAAATIAAEVAAKARRDDARRAVAAPRRRRLQIYALDPMRMENTGAGFVTPRITLSVPYEPLAPGPVGKRIQVVDYDGARRTFYEPVNLDDPHLLLSDGLTPSENDPRFHQQMVYAVVASTWEAFEAASGRRIGVRGGPLKVFPHAFYGENAFYDPTLKALLFGYFQADEREAGANLPGQMVFTCVSHDIIAHETTHAIVDRLRPGFNEITNADVLAFHEAFADLVAIFQHFKLEQVLVDAINERKADLTTDEAISGMARQFGFASAQKAPLRTALDDTPDPAAYQRTLEPHARGVILVQAVFDAYRTTYLARVQDLLRLASGGSGILQAGRPHPDLVNRLAQEARATARLFFDRCVGAFTYLPPIDVTFADFLRALVTVDFVTSPDEDSFRTAIIEAFRRRGIYAGEAGSLADRAVALPFTEMSSVLPDAVSLLWTLTARDRGEFSEASADDRAIQKEVFPQLAWWAKQNAVELGLQPHVDKERPISVAAAHSTVRIDIDGQPQVVTVLQVVQRRPDLAAADHRLGGIVPKAGATVVIDAAGVVRYVISKSLAAAPGPGADVRLDELARTVDRFDRSDPRAAYRGATDGRMRVNFALLHGGHTPVEEE